VTSTSSPRSALRIGLVGAGFMGRQHVEFLKASADATLAAVADPAAEPGAFECPVFPDAGSMLEAADLDAVIIANPNALHVGTATTCLDAGVAVLLEKPVAVDYRQARELVDAVARTGGRLLVGHHRRHHPAVARARRMLGEGLLGELVAVSGLWAARKEDAYFADVPWHREPGAGVLLINAVHDLDLLRHLCGEATQVQAMASSQARGLVVDDTLSVNLRFESGVVGSFLATDAAASPWGWDQSTEDAPEFPYFPGGSAYQFAGTRGALSVPDLAFYGYDPSVPSNWHSPLSRTYVAVNPRNSFHGQLAHFLEVVRGDAEPLVTAEDASRTLALVEATAQSAATGTTIDVARFRAHADVGSVA
jgi:predicted dehydrogenase